MKKLSDFKDNSGIIVASKLLGIIMAMLSDERNAALKDEKSPLQMFSKFMENSPAEMHEIFAILSEQNPEEYHCDGAEAMLNMLTLANDPVIIGLFISQRRTGDATSSGSVSGNTEE